MRTRPRRAHSPRAGDCRLSVPRTSRSGEGAAAGGDALQVLQLHTLRYGDVGGGRPRHDQRLIRPCQQPRVIFQRDRQDPQIGGGGPCGRAARDSSAFISGGRVSSPSQPSGRSAASVAARGPAIVVVDNERPPGVPRPATCDVQRPPWQQSFRVVAARAPPQFPARLARRPRNDCPPSRRFPTDQWYATRAGSPAGRVATRRCKLSGRYQLGSKTRVSGCFEKSPDPLSLPLSRCRASISRTACAGPPA